MAGTGPVSMIVGSEPTLAVARMRARGFRPCRSPKAFEPIRTAAAPSTMPEELPAWWTWLMRSRWGYFRIATASKPGRVSPMSLKAGFRAPSDCMSVLGAHVLVAGEDVQAVDVGDGDDRPREAAFGPGGGGAALALDGVGVDVVAGEAELGGDDVGGDALRDEVGRERERGVDGDGGAVGAHGDAAHHLDAAGDVAVAGAGADLVGGEVHRFEARGAEAVDREAGDLLADSRGEDGGAGEAAALLADLA